MSIWFGARRWLPLPAAVLLAASACDDEFTFGSDAGADGDTGADTDVDTDVDTDTDTDTGSDAGPDGGEPGCEADPERIFDDVAYLASEALAGRPAGTDGNELALQFGEGVFEEIGLVPIGDDGTYRQAFSYDTGSGPVIFTENVLGAIPGTDPEIGGEVVIVGGHIDHLGVDTTYCDPYGATCYGADDNASGAAVTLELARMISECVVNPARTIVFALWNGEEDPPFGLNGSRFYVANPIYPLESTIAVFSADMVGAGEDTNLVLYGAIDGANAWLAQVMAGSALDMGLDWYVTPGEVVPYSDHYPFADPTLVADPIPAVCAMSGLLETHPYYHTPYDTIDNVGPSYLEMSASMLYAGLKPLVEGTEEIYLTSGKAMLEDVPPARVDWERLSERPM